MFSWAREGICTKERASEPAGLDVMQAHFENQRMNALLIKGVQLK